MSVTWGKSSNELEDEECPICNMPIGECICTDDEFNEEYLEDEDYESAYESAYEIGPPPYDPDAGDF